MAMVHEAQGEREQARAFYERAAAAYAAALGPEHESTVEARRNAMDDAEKAAAEADALAAATEQLQDVETRLKLMADAGLFREDPQRPAIAAKLERFELQQLYKERLISDIQKLQEQLDAEPGEAQIWDDEAQARGESGQQQRHGGRRVARVQRGKVA